MGAALIPPDSSVHGDSSSIRLVRDVAPNVILLNLRVLDGSGSGIDSAVIAGIQRAIQLKSQYSIRVTNLSYLLNKPGGTVR
jgi:subtilisin family serine protease